MTINIKMLFNFNQITSKNVEDALHSAVINNPLRLNSLVVYMNVVVSTYIYMFIYVGTCVYLWKAEGDVGCLPSSFFALCIEADSLI